MSHSKNTHKSTDKIKIDGQEAGKDGEQSDSLVCEKKDSCMYSVTVSTKPSQFIEETPLCSGHKSFISIHSTDHLCQLPNTDDTANLDECNVEVLSLNEVFPSTSDDSLSNDDDSPVQKKRTHKSIVSKAANENMKSTYVPSNSKSVMMSGRPKEATEGQSSVYSNIDIPKSTMYVVGSNPGEPKMSYPDPPKKISKTMKKFLKNIDKHKNEQSNKTGEKAISKLTTMRGILKDGRCGPECTGDTIQGNEEFTPEALAVPFPMDFCPQVTYAKQSPDKNVTFNTQVVIIHFTGDLFVGQSVETLSKEKDQQARNSELRKTFLTKYNEFWPAQK